jgi:hypothetical protein
VPETGVAEIPVTLEAGVARVQFITSNHPLAIVKEKVS